MSDNKDVHQMFIDVWGKVYQWHPANSDIRTEFEAKYGEHIPRNLVDDFEYNVEDFIAQIDTMKGFCGIRWLDAKSLQDPADGSMARQSED